MINGPASQIKWNVVSDHRGVEAIERVKKLKPRIWKWLKWEMSIENYLIYTAEVEWTKNVFG